jgi:hypothetical protein
MAATYKTIEVWVVIDQDGDYAAGADRTAADEQFEATVNDFASSDGIRRVRVSVRVPLPTVLEVSAEVSEDDAAEASAQ